MIKISVVSPVYNAEGIVSELVVRVVDALATISDNYEIVLVEDGSRDNSWQKIEIESRKNHKVKGIKLSRNFGQHSAITAGLRFAQGEVVIVMDCDLQDNPIYIPNLVEEYKKGFDIILTRKSKRNHSLLKNFFAKAYNRIFNYLVDNQKWKSNYYVGSYSLLSRKVVDAFLHINDYRRHYLMILRWIGFSVSVIQVEHSPRLVGKSSYSTFQLIEHAIDGITSYSDKVLKIMFLAGLGVSTLSFFLGLWIIIWSFYKTFLPGWASIAVLILFIGGMIISCIGISAIYVGKVFEQTKNRPLYIVDKKTNI